LTVFKTLKVLAHLFVKVIRPGDREVTNSFFESSCHCYYQSYNYLKAIPLITLPKGTTSELAGLLSTLSL